MRYYKYKDLSVEIANMIRVRYCKNSTIKLDNRSDRNTNTIYILSVYFIYFSLVSLNFVNKERKT
jgi:hypothetical protein